MITKLTFDIYECKEHFADSRKKAPEIDDYFSQHEKEGLVESAPRNCKCDILVGRKHEKRCNKKAFAVIHEKNFGDDDYQIVDAIRIRSVA